LVKLESGHLNWAHSIRHGEQKGGQNFTGNFKETISLDEHQNIFSGLMITESAMALSKKKGT
jgi:hypothetical protein